MELESLNCDHCGAPLEIPLTANYVKCNHCGSQLAVRRSATATFTEKVEQLAETTEQLAEQVSDLTRQSKRAELERQWEHERASLVYTDQEGRQHVPTERAATFLWVSLAGGCIFVSAIVLFLTWQAFTSDFGPSLFSILPFIALGRESQACAGRGCRPPPPRRRRRWARWPVIWSTGGGRRHRRASPESTGGFEKDPQAQVLLSQ